MSEVQKLTETMLAEPLSIHVLAERSGYSEYYFSHKFKEEMNVSINDYILQEKIAQAKFRFQKVIGMLLVNTVQRIFGYNCSFFIFVVFFIISISLHEFSYIFINFYTIHKESLLYNGFINCF